MTVEYATDDLSSASRISSKDAIDFQTCAKALKRDSSKIGQTHYFFEQLALNMDLLVDNLSLVINALNTVELLQTELSLRNSISTGVLCDEQHPASNSLISLNKQQRYHLQETTCCDERAKDYSDDGGGVGARGSLIEAPNVPSHGAFRGILKTITATVTLLKVAIIHVGGIRDSLHNESKVVLGEPDEAAVEARQKRTKNVDIPFEKLNIIFTAVNEDIQKFHLLEQSAIAACSESIPRAVSMAQRNLCRVVSASGGSSEYLNVLQNLRDRRCSALSLNFNASSNGAGNGLLEINDPLNSVNQLQWSAAKVVRYAQLNTGAVSTDEETNKVVSDWLADTYTQIKKKDRTRQLGLFYGAPVQQTPERFDNCGVEVVLVKTILQKDGKPLEEEITKVTRTVEVQTDIPFIQEELRDDVSHEEDSTKGEGKTSKTTGVYHRTTVESRDNMLPIEHVKGLLRDYNIPFMDVDSPDFDIFTEIKKLEAMGRAARLTGKGSRLIYNNPDADELGSSLMIGPCNVMVYVCMNVFLRYGFVQSFEFDVVKLLRFCIAIQAIYRPETPYHNSIHGADVCQTTHIYLRTNDVHKNFSDLEIFALIFSAMCHDVGHLGVTNQFLSKVNHPLVRMYNQKSPLENMHAAIALHILTAYSECNFLSSNTAIFSKESFTEFRTLVVDIILGTDMAFHASIIASVQDILADGMIEDEEVGLLLKAIVHAADLSNPMKPLHLYLNWMRRVNEEFWLQGDEEKRRGLPISMMCDRGSAKLPASQVGFISFIVKPFITAFSVLLPPMWVERLDYNLAFMKWQTDVANRQELLKDAKENEKGTVTVLSKFDIGEFEPDSTLNIADELFNILERGGGEKVEAFTEYLQLQCAVEPWRDTFLERLAFTLSKALENEEINSIVPLHKTGACRRGRHSKEMVWKELADGEYMGCAQSVLASIMSIDVEPAEVQRMMETFSGDQHVRQPMNTMRSAFVSRTTTIPNSTKNINHHSREGGTSAAPAIRAASASRYFPTSVDRYIPSLAHYVLPGRTATTYECTGSSLLRPYSAVPHFLGPLSYQNLLDNSLRTSN